MTTVGRWNPNKVRARVLDGTWVSPEELGGMVLLTPTSVDYTGTSATVGANGSVEFTAVSSLSLNGVFSADYDNYMVSFGLFAQANLATVIACRMRDSGTDNTTASSYVAQRLRADGTAVNAVRTTDSAWLYFTRVGDSTATTLWGGTTAHFYGPYLAQPTAFRTAVADTKDSALIEDWAGTHNQSVSYDGFTFYPTVAGRSLSGLVSVYGLVGA
jgi:hypothetical protein